MGDRKLGHLTDQERNAVIEQRRVMRMAVVDAMKPEMRALVHEYGFYVVKTLIDVGVRKPRHIRHIVETVLDEFSPTRGSLSKQGVKRAPRHVSDPRET